MDWIVPAPAPATIPIKVLILHVARTLMWIMEGDNSIHNTDYVEIIC